jgi:hypothetical protein
MPSFTPPPEHGLQYRRKLAKLVQIGFVGSPKTGRFDLFIYFEKTENFEKMKIRKTM